MYSTSLKIFSKFVVEELKGYEKGEGQTFLNRLFKAFGHEDCHDAGAKFEERVKVQKKTKFEDLLWPNKVIVEMKSRGKKLYSHVLQAREYWNNSYGNDKTPYVILCNFDEFWIYNWYIQDAPLDIVKISEIDKRWRALSFLAANQIEPIFANNVEIVTTEAVDKLLQIYHSLINRNIDKKQVQRFLLQLLVCLFAEDISLFPQEGFFLDLIRDCKDKESTYDLFPLLFNQMANPNEAKGGRFKGVKYFNGGIFKEINPIELNANELELLESASLKDWSKIEPAIFGNIFEYSMDKKEQHARGSHYTYEKDIMLIIRPTIIEPLLKEINEASTLKKLRQLRKKLSQLKILDPACGSGNFLYIALRELKKLEIEILSKINEYFSSYKIERAISAIQTTQFHGIDINFFAVELAKITLSLGKKIFNDEFIDFIKGKEIAMDFIDSSLPFDDLDNNIVCADALKTDWTECDVIISNPPYLGCKRILTEYGDDYITFLEKEFPNHNKMSDYVTYWFDKASLHLKENQRAGFVATNTVTQTNSREASLDLIVERDGVIYNAVSTQIWSGEAKVHVSIVNFIQNSSKEIEEKVIDGKSVKFISTSLTANDKNIDIYTAKPLLGNKDIAFQGVSHIGEGLLLTEEEKNDIILKEPISNEVIKPYLIGKYINSQPILKISRYIIFFKNMPLEKAMKYKTLYEKVLLLVKPFRDKNRDKKTREEWWLPFRVNINMLNKIQQLGWYIACSRVSKHLHFIFVDKEVISSDVVIAFAFNDFYHFGLLESTFHIKWAWNKCSTLKGDIRYTSKTIFETFPFPKNVPQKIEKEVSDKAEELYLKRKEICKEHNMGFTKVYNMIAEGGFLDLKQLHDDLDKTVCKAYGFKPSILKSEAEILEKLLELNLKYAAEQEKA